MKNWKNRLHEVKLERCAHLIREVHWIGTKVHNPPCFDGLSKVTTFLEEFEDSVLEELRIAMLDVSLHNIRGY